jgi:hypothetical protein
MVDWWPFMSHQQPDRKTLPARLSARPAQRKKERENIGNFMKTVEKLLNGFMWPQFTGSVRKRNRHFKS